MNFFRESVAVQLAARLAAGATGTIGGWPQTREGLTCRLLELAGVLARLSPDDAARLRFAEPGPIGTATGQSAWPVAVDTHGYLVGPRGHRLRVVPAPAAQP